VKLINFILVVDKLYPRLLKSFVMVLCLIPLATVAATANRVNRCAFVANAYDYSINQYIVDESGDLLSHGQTFTVDKFPSFVIVHPNQKWAYVSSRTVDLLRSFKIDNQTCTLSELSSEGVDIKLRSPFRAVFHPTGNYLYVAGRGGALGAYAIDPKSGSLSLVPGQPFPTGERTRSVAMHPSGKFVYATNAYDNTVSGFRIDENSGALSALKNSPYGVGEPGPFTKVPPIMPDLNVDRGALPYYIAIHPNGNYAYVTNYVASSISQYRIDKTSGELHLIGKPVPAANTPYPIVVHPNGRFAFVATWGGNDILVYAIDEKTGQLSEKKDMRRVVDLQRPVDLEFNHDASRLYAVCIGGDDVAQLAVNGNSGEVMLRRRIHSRAGPLTLAFSNSDSYAKPSSQDAYIISAEQRELYHYKIDSNSGKLLKKSSIITGKDPSSVQVDPHGRVVIVSNRGDNNLTLYDIKGGGKLTRMKYSPFAVGHAPEQLKIDDNGWYLYLSDYGDQSLQFFLLHKDSAEPAETIGSPLPLTVSADILRLDPLARFTFSLNKEKRLFSFNRSQAVIMAAHTPQMDFGSPMKMTFDADLMEVDKTGRFMIFVDNHSKKLRPYRIHPSVGSVHEVPERVLSVDDEIRDMKFQPLDGRALFLLSAGKLQVLAFDAVNGKLKFLRQLAVDSSLDRLWMSADGKFIYLTAKNNKQVWIVALKISNSGDGDRLAAVKVIVGKPLKQTLSHSISDVDFSLSVLP